MQNDTSRFVANLIPLANIQSNTTGLDATTQLSNTVANIVQMVNFDQKRIFTDYLSAYTTGNAIQVLSPLNLSNTSLQVNNTTVIDGTTGVSSFGGPTTGLTNALTSLQLYSTINATEAAISLNVLNRPIFEIQGTGNALFQNASTFRISTATLYAPSLIVDASGTFGGVVYAQNFVTTSDENRKENIQLCSTAESLAAIGKLNTYKFQYKGLATTDIGLLAQDVREILPECVEEGPVGLYVKYNGIVGHLVGSIRSLEERVRLLEDKLAKQFI